MSAAARKPRLSKEELAAVEAKRLAALLAQAAPEHEGELAPPAFINDPRLAPALAVWRELAPQLTKSGRLHQLDRFTFAMLCYWQGEFVAAMDDRLKRGTWFMVKAVSGGALPRKNPSVDREAYAYEQVMALSVKFGLTPLDRVALLKARRDNLTDEDDVDLFKPATTATPPADEVADPWDKRLN